MSLSNWLENEVLNHVFGIATLSPPAGILIGLSKEDPGEFGGGLQEPSDGDNYARLVAAPHDWVLTSEHQIQNATGFVFPKATGTWGEITHVVLFDSIGNMYMYGELDEPVVIPKHGLASFRVGSLQVAGIRDFSDFLRRRILGHIFRKLTFTLPYVIGVGLNRGKPAADGSGLNEPSSTDGYQRIAAYAPVWSPAADGRVYNLSELSFPKATGGWGTVTHFVLFDAITGGNMFMSGSVGTVSVEAGCRPTFAATDLSTFLT